MVDAAHATYTQQNNVIGNLNLLWAIKEISAHAHLIKLGTMGEYGTPDIDIPEGSFEVEYRGRTANLPFPRQAGSFYHLSKVHDSHNTQFACQTWGLAATDIMQGVVFGVRFEGLPNDTRLLTRLDFDQCFGTVINRFCCQALIEHPLTVFGSGTQKRSFLPLRDSMRCLKIVIDNPPAAGEYRVFNQFESCYSILELAKLVQEEAANIGKDVLIHHLENPRTEAEQHYYNPEREKLIQLGYQPTHDIEADIYALLRDLLPYQERIAANKACLLPDIRWNGTRQPSKVVYSPLTEPIQ